MHPKFDRQKYDTLKFEPGSQRSGSYHEWICIKYINGIKDYCNDIQMHM